MVIVLEMAIITGRATVIWRMSVLWMVTILRMVDFLRSVLVLRMVNAHLDIPYFPYMAIWKVIRDCSKLQLGMVTMTILDKTKVERVQHRKNVR